MVRKQVEVCDLTFVVLAVKKKKKGLKYLRNQCRKLCLRVKKKKSRIIFLDGLYGENKRGWNLQIGLPPTTAHPCIFLFSREAREKTWLVREDEKSFKNRWTRLTGNPSARDYHTDRVCQNLSPKAYTLLCVRVLIFDSLKKRFRRLVKIFPLRTFFQQAKSKLDKVLNKNINLRLYNLRERNLRWINRCLR